MLQAEGKIGRLGVWHGIHILLEDVHSMMMVGRTGEIIE